MKISIILLGICLLVLLTGCPRGSLRGGEPVDVHRGNDGLTVRFFDQNPPKKILPNTQFTATIELTNEGGADVFQGFLSLAVEDTFVTLYGDRIIEFSLPGRTPTIPIGDSQIYTFQLESNRLGPQTETVTTNIGLNVCYPYSTEAELSICVDTDVFQLETAQKSCTPKPIRLSGGQGGPIAVTRVTPQYSLQADTDRIRAIYSIEISNVGGGQTYDVTKSFEACTPLALSDTTGRKVWNVASIAAFLGDRQLTCSTSGTLVNQIVFEKGKATVQCTLPQGIASTAGTFSTTMRIELEYGYTFTESKQVQITRLP